MALTQDYAGKIDAAPRQSPFDSLASALSELSEVQGSIQTLADRLTGPTPTGVGVSTSRDRGGGPGLIDGVEYACNTIREIAEDVRNNLRRIDKRL